MQRKKIYFVFGFFIFAIPFFAFLCSYLLSGTNNQALARMSVRKPAITQSTQKFGTNFYAGTSVDMSQILPTSPKYVVNSKGEDLIDIAEKLGVTMIRITNTTSQYGNGKATYTRNEWNAVLNKMLLKRMKAVILIESPSVYQKYIQPGYLSFVQNYVIDSRILNHPSVYGVDLYNEPVINSENNILQLKTAAQMIKKKYPFTRLTVGWWAVDTLNKSESGKNIYKWDDYAHGRDLETFIDFYSIHMYGFDNKNFFGMYPDAYSLTNNFISSVKSNLQTKKPILIEEFGASNGDTITDQKTLGSPELQANIYYDVYRALIDMNDSQIIGAVSYQLIAKTTHPDSWAMLKHNGNYLFPAAYVLQKFTKGKSDVELTLPFTNIPNAYILTDTDNQTTKSLKVKDIIGLSLSLDSTQTYTASISGDPILSQTQELIYDREDKKYYSVFHATQSGMTKIVVKKKNANEVFTTSFNIE